MSNNDENLRNIFNRKIKDVSTQFSDEDWNGMENLLNQKMLVKPSLFKRAISSWFAKGGIAVLSVVVTLFTFLHFNKANTQAQIQVEEKGHIVENTQIPIQEKVVTTNLSGLLKENKKSNIKENASKPIAFNKAKKYLEKKKSATEKNNSHHAATSAGVQANSNNDVNQTKNDLAIVDDLIIGKQASLSKLENNNEVGSSLPQEDIISNDNNSKSNEINNKDHENGINISGENISLANAGVITNPSPGLIDSTSKKGSRISIGILAGVNYINDLGNWDASITPLPGIFVKYKLGKQFNLLAELQYQYVKVGQDFSYPVYGTQEYIINAPRLNFLQFPILLERKVGMRNAFQAGVRLGYLFSPWRDCLLDKDGNEILVLSTDLREKLSHDGLFPKLDIGLMLGYEITLNKRISFGARYCLGLRDLSNDDFASWYAALNQFNSPLQAYIKCRIY